MPNFFTHWLVANECIGKWDAIIPPYIKNGRTAYHTAARAMKADLKTAITKIKSDKDFKDFKKDDGEFKQILDTFDKALLGIDKDTWGKDLPQDKTIYDNITCFSAYMLGACGPDLWTVPCGGLFSIASTDKSIAPHHFDLGHYNRTHMVFKTFIYHLVKNKGKFPDQDGIQAKVATSYFMGLATHFAADLIIHQLVNVSAGAYGLLEKRWRIAEQGIGSLPMGGLSIKWSTHNKVEHYLDSYFRYVYFSDYSFIWKDKDHEKKLWNGFAAPGFPVVETLGEIGHTENKKTDQLSQTSVSEINWQPAANGSSQGWDTPTFMPADVREDLKKFLSSNKNKLQIEKCFNLPRIFCDRMTAVGSDLQPFLYDMIVNKKEKPYPGAYPKDIMYKAAIKEANSKQFQDGQDEEDKSEKKKLGYFSSALNGTKLAVNGVNFLNYETLPDLAKVKKYGWEKFYDLTALPEFINSAVTTAGSFLSALALGMNNAFTNQENIDTVDSVSIGTLDQFWNLDTGLGLRIEKGPYSKTTKEAYSVLNFFHVIQEVNKKNVDHRMDTTYIGSDNKKKVAYEKNPKETNVFKIYKGEAADNILSVKEEKGKCLAKIDVNNPAKSVASVPVPTLGQNDGKLTIIVAQVMWDRLNLEIKAGIADFQNNNETLGLYLLGDNKKEHSKENGSLTGHKLDDHFIHKWLKDKKTKPYDFIQTSDEDPRDGVNVYARTGSGVCEFYTHFLATIQKETEDMKKEYDAGKWCNVIPYDAFKERYGSNFAVGTGRQNVLRPRNWMGDFDSNVDFKCYNNVSPTEFVYFSVHPLIRLKKGETKYMDIITKQEFDLEIIKTDLIKIDWVGFVKIVLLYEYIEGEDRGVTLTEYYIDGCKFDVNGYPV